MRSSTVSIKNPKGRENLKYMWKYKELYFMALPGIIYFIIFKYIPLLGNIIAFQDYSVFTGILKSKFIGLKQFETLFSNYEFSRILTNSLSISFYDLLLGFAAPIIFALMINEMSNERFKRMVQQTIYLPHFLSWTVLGGIVVTQLLSPEMGLVNLFLRSIGQESIYFMIEPKYAKAIVVVAGLWRDMGWGTIVYLAAMTAINPSLYEAASVDGAGRFRQLIAITLPAILPIIATLFLIRIGHFLDFGFERIWVFRNSANRPALEIFDTYIYQAGLMEGRFSYTTAIGLFKSIIGAVLLLGGNAISRKTTGEGLF